MAFGYVIADRDQLILVPTSMQEWLDEGHLAWFVIDIVKMINTSALHARHPNDGPGRPAYDPDMMLALLFYAYCMGTRSSRRIERFCITDAAYRVICANATPDHATVARFLVDHEEAIEGLFVEVLRLCAAAGLVTVGTVAIDGTKIAANAALDVNRDVTAIRAQVVSMLAEAKSTDENEDSHPDLFGGDSLPSDLATRSGRLGRLTAALEKIEADETQLKEEAQAKAEAARREAEVGNLVNGRKPKDPEALYLRAQIDHDVMTERLAKRQVDWDARKAEKTAQGKSMTGFRPSEDCHLKRATADLEQARLDVVAAREGAGANKPKGNLCIANTTDPDSRIMKTKDGYVQGYNAQAAVNENQIVLAAAVTQECNDLLQYQPMVAATQKTLEQTDAASAIGIVLGDAGYWSEANATASGPGRLIATLKDHKQRSAARKLGTTTGPPPEGATTLEAMEHQLRTPEGAALYAKRSHTVEPVFGDLKENKNFRRFRRRGLGAVQSEWFLMNIAHNLGKLFAAREPVAVT